MFQSTFLRPFKETCSEAANPLSDLVEVCDEPVDKWRNLQVCSVYENEVPIDILIVAQPE